MPRSMNTFPFITVLTLIPLAGAALLVGLGPDHRKLARWLALGFSFVALAVALTMWIEFKSLSGELQFEETAEWIPSLKLSGSQGVQYHVGVDGLGLLMVLLSAIVVPMAMLASWKIEERVPLYFSLVLFLQAGLFGTFTALNFFHWFIFWEISLIPAFFLINLWGGPQRGAAATQFFIYTMVGSIALLLSFLAIYQAVGTFDFIRLGELGRTGELATALSAKLGWYHLTAK